MTYSALKQKMHPVSMISFFKQSSNHDISKTVVVKAQSNPFTRQFLVPKKLKSDYVEKCQINILRVKQSERSNSSTQCRVSWSQKHRYRNNQQMVSDRRCNSECRYYWQDKKKQIDVERQRIALFGIDIMKYQNAQYFHKNPKSQFSQNVKNIFKESTNVYLGQLKGGLNIMEKEPSLNRTSQKKKQKNSKLRKMLSWNKQIQKQHKQPQDKRRCSENQLNFVSSKFQQESGDRCPTFRFISTKENKKKVEPFGLQLFQNSVEEQQIQEMVDQFKMSYRSQQERQRVNSPASNHFSCFAAPLSVFYTKIDQKNQAASSIIYRGKIYQFIKL